MAQAKKWRRVWEQGAGFLFGEVFQVCSVDGGDGVVEQFFDLLEAALAGGGGAGLFEGGLFFAFVLVVGEGAFGPAPLFGVFVHGARGLAVAACPFAIGGAEGGGGGSDMKVWKWSYHSGGSSGIGSQGLGDWELFMAAVWLRWLIGSKFSVF